MRPRAWTLTGPPNRAERSRSSRPGAGWLAFQVALVMLGAGCQATSPGTLPPPSAPQGSGEVAAPDPQEVRPEAATRAGISADPDLRRGTVLRSVDEQDWGLRLRLPVSAGLTKFGSLEDISLDNLATLSIVPTLDLVVPLDEHWTLLPFVGLGGAVQLGDRDLVGGSRWIGLATGGVRIERWQRFAERYIVLVTSRARYDSVLGGRNGLLGDWGSVDASAEVRRAFGRLDEEPSLQAGLYLQATHFWLPVELDIAGVSPAFIDDATEIGVSLGSTAPIKLLGFSLPRVFLGFRSGDSAETYRIRFGRL